MPIRKYLPLRERTDYLNVQAKIPIHLAEQCKKIMEKENFSWSDVITACLENFVDEIKKEK